MKFLHFYRHKDWAAMCEIFEALFSHEAEINTADTLCETILHHAVRANEPSLITLLPDHGANLDIRIGNGPSPMKRASFGSYYDAFRCLLRKKPDHKAAFKYNTIWHAASLFPYSSDFSAEIKSLSHDFNFTDATKWAPLMQAVFRDSPAGVNYF